MIRVSNVINTPIEIYGRQVKNRIVFHPMEGCDGKRNGAIDELTRRRYLRFARSGAGIIWFEATAVCAEGRANPRQLFINEETVDSYSQLVAADYRPAYSQRKIQQTQRHARADCRLQKQSLGNRQGKSALHRRYGCILR